MEGPFGEYLGHVNGAAPAAVVEITAITRRAAALHHGFVQQMPPSDGHLVMEIGMLGPLWFNLTRKLGVKGIRNLAIARGSAGLSILVAQIERAYASESSRIGRLLAKFNSGQKFIYLVDEDIDIRDQETLNWALSSRVNAPQGRCIRRELFDASIYVFTVCLEPRRAIGAGGALLIGRGDQCDEQGSDGGTLSSGSVNDVQGLGRLG